MNALPRRPSLSLRGWSVLTRALLWLVLLTWLMFAAAMAALHYFIVPRIDALRPVLEEQGSQALGLPLRIGALRAQVDQLLLTFELEDVQVQDRAGETALQLPKVLVTLTPMSILRLGFDQIAIESPELTVRRSSDGRIFLAGIEIPQQPQGNGAGIEWVLDQTEWLVRGGRIVWRDEVRAAAPLPLYDVDLRLRKRLRWHEMRLDATPPVALGERFSLRGRFRQDLLALNATDWQRWEGMLYAVAGRVDVDTLQQYVSLPPTLKTEIRGGQGALRVWLDVEQGRVNGVAADLALSGLALRLGPTLPMMELEYLRGRFEGSVEDGSYVLASEGLDFRTRDGLHWQGGEAQVGYALAQGRKAEEGKVRLSGIDLAALAELAQRLPLAPPVHVALERFAPHGRIDRLDLSWQGARDASGLPPRYKLSGQISDLNVAAQAAPGDDAGGKPKPGLPGVRNLNLSFNADEKGGRANVRVQRGHLEWPGVFEIPRLALDRLNADVQWRGGMQAPRNLQVSKAQVSNADFEGDFQLKWDATSQAAGAVAQRSPGLLDLQANLSRVRLPAVHRYFPQAVPAPVRAYLRDAMTQGHARNVRVRLRGDLRDFPFHGGRPGEFRVMAQVQDARLVYVPQFLLPAGSPPWPVLNQLQGEFVLEQTSLQLNQVSARVENAPALQLRQSTARIPDFMRDARVQVDLRLDGPLNDMLRRVVQPSPLDGLLGGVLTQASATGDAQAQVQFEVPFRAVPQSTVQGLVRFGGNSFRFIPGMPPLTQVRGALYFNERGFALDDTQGQFLGDVVQAEGGSINLPQGGLVQSAFRGTGVLDAMQELLREAGRKTGLDMLRDEAESLLHVKPMLRVRGEFTAQGLRQGLEQLPAGSELASVAFLAKRMSGDARYTLDFDFSQGLPELELQTTLQGLALDWPAPLNKPADAPLPLRVQIRRLADSAPPVADAEQGMQEEVAGPRRRSLLSLDFGRAAMLRIVRVHEAGADGKTFTRVQGGGIVLNLTSETPDDLPSEDELLSQTDVIGQLRFGELDLDAWRELWLEGAPASSSTLKSPAGPASDAAVPNPYFPAQWTMQGGVLRVAGQRLQDFMAGGSREDRRWRVNLSARELDGYFEYQPPASGTEDSAKVHVRLAHLHLGAEQPSAAEAPSDTQPKAVKTPVRLSGIPALDVVVERLELGDKKLGRLEVQAVNRGVESVEWQLDRLRLTMPEAEFTANGIWTAADGPLQEPDTEVQRQTVMDFDLDVRNAGRLLGRLGMPGVIRAGEGKMQGQVKWTGSPLSPDIPSMSGTVNLNIEKGQFLKADPGIAKLLGVLSLQTLPRRLMLDFRDVFSEGFAFDFVRGDARIQEGQARTNNLQMKGVNAGVLMSGSADLIQETQDLRVVIVPEINAGTAALIAAWINPAVGLTTFLAQAILTRPLIASATQEFHVTGSWSEPQVRKVTRAVPQTSGTPSLPSDTQ